MSHAPTTAEVRVMSEPLRRFAREAGLTIGLPEAHATLLADLLIDCDLRGTFTHGTRTLLRYTREIQRGGINPTPDVRCVKESPVSVVMDGDGGLGYFPAVDGTRRIIAKAREQGMAALVCRNHGHIGAAGHYSQLALDADLITFVTSGVQMHLEPGTGVHRAAGGSPMCFSAPSLEEPPLVLDLGVTHNMMGTPENRDQVIALLPGMIVRAIGYGTVCQAWGGLLAGLPVTPPAMRRHPNADQGMFLFACRVDLFADVDAFKREIDTYSRQVRQLKPVPGTEGAFLPGHLEAEREARHRVKGIPLRGDHLSDLETLVDLIGLAKPW